MYKTKCFNSLENLFGGRFIPKFYTFTDVCWLWIKPLLLCSMTCQDDHRWLIQQSVGFWRASWSHETTELLLLRSIESPWFSLFLVQFSSVAQSCPTLCDPMDCSMPGLPVHHQPTEHSTSHHLPGLLIPPRKFPHPCFSFPSLGVLFSLSSTQVDNLSTGPLLSRLSLFQIISHFWFFVLTLEALNAFLYGDSTKA